MQTFESFQIFLILTEILYHAVPEKKNTGKREKMHFLVVIAFGGISQIGWAEIYQGTVS